jgi:hypothetical protein
VDGTNKFTLLDNAVRGFGDLAATGRIGAADGRRQLIGLHDLGGGRRRPFGVGEGPAEAVAEAKQARTDNTDSLRRARRWLAWESRSGEVVSVSLESASFLRQSPVVNHLSLTCSSTCQPVVTLVFV